MRDTSTDKINPEDIKRVSPIPGIKLPFFSSLVSAGFASPATDHIEDVLSLDELCDTHRETTYMLRCSGDSMKDDGLWDGDTMVIDRRPRTTYEGQIVIAWINGGLVVKRYHKTQKLVVLMPANEAFLPIYVQPGDAFFIYGVVTFWVRKSRYKHID